MPEPVYEAGSGANAEFDTRRYRFGYTSMVTPPSIFELDLDSGERELLDQLPVLGDVDLSAYKTERITATAPDGTAVPISLVWKPSAVSWPAPCLLYGYGAYEIGMPASFSTVRLSLLDRGVLFAIAHVRGGGELGRAWYEGGKLDSKHNTFDDFAACAGHSDHGPMGRPATDLRPGRQRRRPAHGGDGEPPPGAVLRGGSRGALRRRVEHDARPGHPLDCHRVRRVGRPDRPGGVRDDPVICALRECRAGRPPSPAGHRWAD